MEKNFEKIAYQTLVSTRNELWAVSIQEDLKKAGFDILVTDDGDNHYSVVVNKEDYPNVKALLKTNPKYGQIFTVPKE